MTTRSTRSLAIGCIAIVTLASTLRADPPAEKPGLFDKSNLVAWCIVPFDGKKRTPEQRVEMLHNLGITKYAYDWRAEHLPTFDQELTLLAKYKIELTALWFPGGLSKDARFLLDALKKHDVKTQLWVSAGVKVDADEKATIDRAAATIKPIAAEAAAIGCTVALYNHGGWFGEPENQLAIIQRLKADNITNVGIVYNLHHGHDHLDRFAAMLAKIKPHLMCLNLNGMSKGGDKTGKKILPIGCGELDLDLLKTIRASGYTGPIGILNHTNEDAQARLLDNIEGLNWLAQKLDDKNPGPRPVLRSYKTK